MKTVFLYERSFRQKYATSHPHDGYEGSEAELAWLFAKRQPPPLSRVWIACADCEQRLAVRYEPSAAPLFCAAGGVLNAHITTLALGYVALQVFSVDYLEAERRGASRGWPEIPEAIRPGIVAIWPIKGTVEWPPPCFPRAHWDRLVTWAGALRWDSEAEPIRFVAR